MYYWIKNYDIYLLYRINSNPFYKLTRKDEGRVEREGERKMSLQIGSHFWESSLALEPKWLSHHVRFDNQHLYHLDNHPNLLDRRGDQGRRRHNRQE